MKTILTLLLLPSIVLAQQEKPDLLKIISHEDSIVFSIVYKCQPDRIINHFTEDLEFYHDKAAVTYSRDEFMSNLQRNFCGEHAFYLRREPVPGTMKVFALDNYGAVQTGEHWFYANDNNGVEHRTGVAKYTHIWKFSDNTWKISRVISYDHQPAN